MMCVCVFVCVCVCVCVWVNKSNVENSILENTFKHFQKQIGIYLLI